MEGLTVARLEGGMFVKKEVETDEVIDEVVEEEEEEDIFAV